MSEIKVNERVARLKKKLQEVGEDLIGASQKFGLSKETKEILETQLININDNFLFVIAGEVNAGKSSFVNALLGAPVCATSHEICTNDVQKITYGKTEKIRDVEGEKFAVREFPADILKQITIVDTPGTNSKELDHQIITEQFIPHANLIMFVFMTENIHAETAWNLFRTIKDKWGKKVAFVLTKKDMYNDEQVESYKATLKRYVENEGIENPKIFTTSAMREQNGNYAESGFNELRDYINHEVLSDAAEDKVKDDFKTLTSLFGNLSSEFDIRRNKYKQDQSIRDEINTIIMTQEDNARDSIGKLVERCLGVYDRNTKEFLRELKKEVGFLNLTWRNIRAIFGGDNTKIKLEQLNKEFAVTLNREMNDVVEGGTDSIKNDIQYMLTRVKNELDKLKVEPTQPTQMFHHLEEQRSEIVSNLKYNLTNFIEKSELFDKDKMIDEEIDYSEANLAGGAAAIGAIVTMIAKSSVLDVTGGILTLLSLLLTGGIAEFKKGKYLSKVRETLAENRAKLKDELERQLLNYFTRIKDSINNQFVEFDQALKTERIQIENFDTVASNVKGKITALEREIG